MTYAPRRYIDLATDVSSPKSMYAPCPLMPLIPSPVSQANLRPGQAKARAKTGLGLEKKGIEQKE